MSARDEMILRHMALVAFVVNRLSTDRTRTLGLDREDAMSYGVEGLIQAVDNFDPGRGISFASFAVRRIRGAVLDAVRRHDPLPRSLRRSTRQVERTAQELATQLGRWPSDKELAVRLGTSPKAVREIRQHASSRFVSLENVLQESNGDNGRHRWDPVDPDERGDPAVETEQRAALHELRLAVSRLSDRDQALLRLRYAESRPFHEVGAELGLSESRVCQLHKRILRQLHRHLVVTLEEAA
ncbi:MAG: sigma-70 family RNA polymerase sigma factor [Dehalococcoidia bacterium]|nr:sigma-70 family RNA polymerase sigma factor [Dehalococcoidia bacterium]